MSREIKFRAWDGKQILTEENFDFVVSDYDSIIQLNECGWTEHGVDCVEQYTGLTDKNGKEIYEGDIVKQVGSNLVCPVEFKYGGFIPFTSDMMTFDNDYCEVIGNIHENPELLGGGK